MELLHGETLSSRLRRVGRFPLDDARRLIEQMCAGLGAAHQAGVVHRDFKPGNVMLVTRDGDERAVVTDSGIARTSSMQGRLGDSTLELASGLISGTPAYMAPEQVRGDEVGPAGDIYALGIVIYELVTGTVPFTGVSAIEIARRRLTEDPPSPRQLVPDLDERWETVILRCLAREPRAIGSLHQERGEVELARSHYESALAIHRAVFDRLSEGSTLAYLGSLLYQQGSIDAAREALAGGSALLRELEAHAALGQLLCIRADVEHGSGDAARALESLREAEDLAVRMGSGPESGVGAHDREDAPDARREAAHPLSLPGATQPSPGHPSAPLHAR